jgi:hypothetical protein
LTFDRLLENFTQQIGLPPDGGHSRLAHDRGCEADLAVLLNADLAAVRLPDIAALRAHFAQDLASQPEVVVHISPLIAYEALLGTGIGEAARPRTSTGLGSR